MKELPNGKCELCPKYEIASVYGDKCLKPVCQSPLRAQRVSAEGVCQDCDEYQTTSVDK